MLLTILNQRQLQILPSPGHALCRLGWQPLRQPATKRSTRCQTDLLNKAESGSRGHHRMSGDSNAETSDFNLASGQAVELLGQQVCLTKQPRARMGCCEPEALPPPEGGHHRTCLSGRAVSGMPAWCVEPCGPRDLLSTHTCRIALRPERPVLASEGGTSNWLALPQR